MEAKEEQLIISLLEKDPELKKYYEEHRELERQILRYQNRSHLTPEEEIEKKRLQKLKLVGKDKIMQILVRYQSKRELG